MGADASVGLFLLRWTGWASTVFTCAQHGEGYADMQKRRYKSARESEKICFLRNTERILSIRTEIAAERSPRRRRLCSRGNAAFIDHIARLQRAQAHLVFVVYLKDSCLCLLPKSQGHNLALTVLRVPYSLDSGPASSHEYRGA